MTLYRNFSFIYVVGLGDPFPQKYDSKSVEAGWDDLWTHLRLEAKKTRSKDPSRPTFSMILPPPNVTGHLHLGHALTVAIQDVLVRWLVSKMSLSTTCASFRGVPLQITGVNVYKKRCPLRGGDSCLI